MTGVGQCTVPGCPSPASMPSGLCDRHLEPFRSDAAKLDELHRSEARKVHDRERWEGMAT